MVRPELNGYVLCWMREGIMVWPGFALILTFVLAIATVIYAGCRNLLPVGIFLSARRGHGRGALWTAGHTHQSCRNGGVTRVRRQDRAGGRSAGSASI